MCFCSAYELRTRDKHVPSDAGSQRFLWASEFEMPISDLYLFKPLWAPSGRRGFQRFSHPRLGALMSCEWIPDELRSTFGHSCLHGRPPHMIRVIVKVDAYKRRSLEEVLKLAEDAERLHGSYVSRPAARRRVRALAWPGRGWTTAGTAPTVGRRSGRTIGTLRRLLRSPESGSCARGAGTHSRVPRARVESASPQ